MKTMTNRKTWLTIIVPLLLVALAVFSVFTGPEPVTATEVEFVSTELEGATVEVYNSENGVTTFWLTPAKDDI